MNRRIHQLSGICREHLLDEKWLLAPSLRAGHGWLFAVVQNGQPVVNGRVKTLANLALELAAPTMMETQCEEASPRRGALLVDRLMHRLRKPDEGYLGKLTPSVRLAERVHQAIDALRRAGLSGEDLDLEKFEVNLKGHELKQIHAEYVKELRRHNWVDRADVLQLAIKRLETDAGAIGEDVLVIIPDDLDSAGLERRLLESLPAQRRIDLPVDQPAPAPASDREPLSDARLLRWLPVVADAQPPSGDGSAAIFRAVGEANEVREVLRRCVSDRIPLDHVEVLCTDLGTYIPLIYEVFAALLPEDASLDQIPVTFQEGIPARKFRPGRALLAWLAWIGDDFPQHGLVSMIQEGLLNIPHHDADDVSYGLLANELRGVGIGFGRDRYRRVLDEHIAGLKLRIDDPQSGRDEDGEARPQSTARLAQRLQRFQLLRGLVETLLDQAPSDGDGPAQVLKLARLFVETRTRRVSQLDNYAGGKLVDEIDDMLDAFGASTETTSLDARAWLSALPDEAQVGGLSPRGGAMHVAHVLAGGHSARTHTFVIGLDDGRFPGAGLQDPILLDDERRRLSRELPTAGGELTRRLGRFAGVLAGLRGNVTLSYSCHELADDREVFPSPVILSAFRILSGQHDGDQAVLNRWLGQPAASFAPDSAEKALTESEWWLWRMIGDHAVVEPETLVAERFPHLGRGFALERARKSDKFTVFDGWIPTPGIELDMTARGGPTVSARRLEMLGQCPLKYFFSYVLEIEPPRELILDPRVWLDPLKTGSLVHEVFETFLRELIERRQLPVFERDEARLVAILDDRVQYYRREIPPPSQAVFRREVARLRTTAAIFLRADEDYYQKTGNRPLFLEAAIGLKTEGPGTRLDSEAPVEIELPGGKSLMARGRIDRVDQVAGPQAKDFAIWDYKTGGTWKYQQNPRPFWQGRVIQHALYVSLVSARLRELGGDFAGARVGRFGFFFPSGKALGERIEFTPEQLGAGGEMLVWMAEIAASGSFLATTDFRADCGFCDYNQVCGDVKAVTAASRKKLENPANTSLGPYRELRGHAQADEPA
jgi:ATP-dependent helicase/nuclease subunit B